MYVYIHHRNLEQIWIPSRDGMTMVGMFEYPHYDPLGDIETAIHRKNGIVEYICIPVYF